MRLYPSRRILALLGLLWLAALLLAPLVGSQSISLLEAFRGEGEAATIFWQLRLPRVLVALLAGGVLALSGLGFQTLFRNPLAEPYTLGVAGGAALGAVLAIRWSSEDAVVGVALASFLGALLASALVVGIALHREGLEASSLLLAGVAVSLTCSALIVFVQYFSDATKTFRMVRWMMGGLAVVGYGSVLWLLPWLLGLTLLLLALRWDLDLLLTGEEVAASRGVDLGRLRLWVLGGTSLAIGALVTVTGPIGFVGLMVPHFLRRLVGSNHRVLVPACLLGGGLLLAGSDLVARTLMAPAELPVGILTAILGGPFFAWLLLRPAKG